MEHPNQAGSPASPQDPFPGRAGAALLLATVFASGAAVMIVEMTAVRAVQPFFGSTTYVWTNVIAVVLAGLAVGYALGGRLADRWPSLRLLYGLLGIGGVCVGLGALFVTPVSRLFLAGEADLEGVVSVLLWGSLGTALVIFAPPVLLLGTIAPMAIRLLARHGVGRAAGSVFALSTVGSIVGTYLPTLVLVPRLGSRGSILVAAGILLVASAVGLFVFGRRRTRAAASTTALLAGAAALVAAGATLMAPDRPAPRFEGAVATVLEETESPYQYLTVRDDAWPDGTERVLTINEGVYTYHALKVPERVLTGSRFYDAYAVVPFLLDLQPGQELRACVVGMACGVNAAQWHHFYSDVYEVRVDGAELDPEVVRLGRRYFDLPDEDTPWLSVITLDGRSLLERTSQERGYHAIVVDAFSNELYVPFHLATREFFELCARRLEDGGILAMNVYAHGEDAPNLRAIENTMATVFSSILSVPHSAGGGYLLLARRGWAHIDPSQLGIEEIHRRFAGWDGYERWTATAEWGSLLALAEGIRTTAALSGRLSMPDLDGRVLTDDHAPIEWLTDRFLWASEAELFTAGDARSYALAALRSRQNRLLLVVGCTWGVALLALALLVGARRGARPPYGGER